MKHCVHPFINVKRVIGDKKGLLNYYPRDLFTYCNNCNKVLEGKIPNPIPHYWSEDTQFLAHILTGYAVEKTPDPTVIKFDSNKQWYTVTNTSATNITFNTGNMSSGSMYVYGVKE